MDLSTPVNIPKSPQPLTYDDRLLFVGSCFADAMAAQLEQYYFRVTANSFGPLFNPLSVLQALELTEVPELIEWGGLFHSMAHHGQCSAPTQEETFALCEQAIRRMQQAFAEATVVFITFGTAWVYDLNRAALNPVANCHKMPAEWFTRRRLTVDEIVAPWQRFMDAHPDKRFVFTVSPVRHLKDGLHQNQLSKATLLLAIERLTSESGRISYFPSYEILLDELRDYRFYGPDMVHVNEVGVAYIFERFCQTWFDEATLKDMHRLHALWQQSMHRSIHPDSAQYQAFLARLEAQRAELRVRFPWI